MQLHIQSAIGTITADDQVHLNSLKQGYLNSASPLTALKKHRSVNLFN